MDCGTFTYEAAECLVRWYRKNKRDLPWRKTHDAYAVWISEIMLQQTRVEAVIDKYTAFMQELPDIAALASVEDDRLMKLWEGLGYYSRARNLKKCAAVIMARHHGRIPHTYDELLALPGIGSYTAGAISAIAFGIPAPAVDGNVMRVLSRLLGSADDVKEPETKKNFENILREFYRDHPCSPAFVRNLTQGFMDLGASVCLPNGRAKCTQCPWQERCAACKNNLTDVLPVRGKAPERRLEERTLLIIRDGDSFLLRKRPERGLLAGLYEFPGIPGFCTKEEAADAVSAMGYEPLQIHVLPESRHLFTHLEWHMHAYEIRVSGIHEENDLLVTKRELLNRAIPSAFRTYLEYYSLRQ